MSAIRDDFLIDPQVIFLNHGSFGACPRPVFNAYQNWQRELEYQPVDFLVNRAIDLLAESRKALAVFLGVNADEVVYFTNPTTAINMVTRNLITRSTNPLQNGDEILTTNHEYGAMDRTWRFICRKTGIRYIQREIPLPVTSHADFVAKFWSGVTERTKVIFISHITSPTALIFPVREICQRARNRGILSIVDGAHAIGQIPTNLCEIGADLYTGACHKWLMSPKGAAFLYAHKDVQPWLDPLVVSWGFGSEYPSDSQFIDYHEWQGTRDLAAFLSVPAAINYQEQNDWAFVRDQCSKLAAETRDRINDLTGLEPLCPTKVTESKHHPSENWFSQMFTARLPNNLDVEKLKKRLYVDFSIEVPTFEWNQQNLIRVSVQGYNTRFDTDQLISALTYTLCSHPNSIMED